MSSVAKALVICGAITAVVWMLPETAAKKPETQKLCVCADPNNMPFSNEAGEGFENAIANLVAEDLGLEVSYVWWPQRRGFIRNTLRAGRCDLVMGVPSSFELALPTRPYYRSTYVFVYRKDSGIAVTSFDDAALHDLRIGIHAIGDDYANVPPAQALANRGIIDNITGYSIYGDYSRPDPPADLVHALEDGEIDLAIAWGPLAGYFAQESDIALEVVPVSPQIDPPFLPFVFDIAMGVRRDDEAFRDQLDAIIERRSVDIRAILDRYGVPLLETSPRRAHGGT